MSKYGLPTPEEALELIIKRRERQREYSRRYKSQPGALERQREHSRRYRKKMAEAYAAAKKAGLV